MRGIGFMLFVGTIKVWHSEAAMAMQQVAQHDLTQHTVETVIRSNGNYTLNDVYPTGKNITWYSRDIWNVKPDSLGMWSPVVRVAICEMHFKHVMCGLTPCIQIC